MVLGFLMIGMVLGLASAGTVLFLGSGLGLAFLCYIGFGLLGTGIGAAMMMLKSQPQPNDATMDQMVSQPV